MEHKLKIIKNILLGLNILGLGAIGYYTQYKVKKDKTLVPAKVLVEKYFDQWGETRGLTKKIPKANPEKRIPFALEVFVANLASIDGEPDYVTFYPVITFADDSSFSEGEFSAHIPKIRDQIIKIANLKTMKSLLKPDGKKKFKEEIKIVLNSLDLPYRIKEVYFSDIVMN